MDYKKITQKINVLTNSKLILEVEKNLSLLTIFKLSKTLNINMKRAFENVDNIELIQKKLNFYNNDFLKQGFFGKNKSNLWIYITEIEKYEVDAYTRYEKNILQKINKKDKIICVGKRANAFALKNELNIIKNFASTTENNITFEITRLIETYYSIGEFSKVLIVVNSNKITNSELEILPVMKINNGFFGSNLKSKKRDLTTLNIFPNIKEFIKNEIHNYIFYMLNSLLIESSFYNAKNKLVRENKLIKELDEDIFKYKRKIARIKSERQIEEIVMISKNKSFIHNHKKGDIHD